jgi:hypothetical protein
MDKQRRYTLAKIANEAGEHLAFVAIERSRSRSTSDGYFADHSRGPESFWSHHPLSWEPTATGNELAEDVGELRLKLGGFLNAGQPAPSDDLVAALAAELSELDPQLHAAFVADVEAPDGATAIATAADA